MHVGSDLSVLCGLGKTSPKVVGVVTFEKPLNPFIVVSVTLF